MQEIAFHLIPMFVRVAKEQSISHAASTLGISQSALSRQLQAFEASVGTSLFIRQSRGITLTTSGKNLLKILEPSFEIIQSDILKFKNLSATLSGTIACGSIAEYGQRIIAPLMLDFCDSHPEISLDLRLLPEQEIFAQLIDGKIGFGLVSRIIGRENIKVYRLAKEQSVVLTSAHNPLDLENHPRPCFIGYSKNDALLMNFVKQYEKKLPNIGIPKIIICVNSHESMLAALENREAYCIMPTVSSEKALLSKKIRVASKYSLSNDIFLICPDHEFSERRYSEVIKFLLKRIKERTKV